MHKFPVQLRNCGPVIDKNIILKILPSLGNLKDSSYIIDFYSENNGGYLPEMYLMDWAKLPALKDGLEITIASFYEIENIKKENILDLARQRIITHPGLKEFANYSIPIARTPGDDEYWLNTHTGEVYYIVYEGNKTLDQGTSYSISDFGRKIADSFKEFLENMISMEDYEKIHGI